MGEQEKVEISIEFITSQGDQLMLTGAAEEQARSAHDIDLVCRPQGRASRAGRRFDENADLAEWCGQLGP